MIYCVCVSVLINEIQVVEHHAMSLANPLDRSTALRVIINSLLSYLSVNFKSSLSVHVAGLAGVQVYKSFRRCSNIMITKCVY